MIGYLLRAVADLASRPLATEVPPMLGRRCPGCGHALDYNCRQVASHDECQAVRCATPYCRLVSVWEWDEDGAVLLWTQRDEQVPA